MKKLTIIFAALQLAAAAPHGPEGTTTTSTTTSIALPSTSVTSPASTLAGPLPPSSSGGDKPAAATGVIAPEGCLRLSTDTDWPAESVWNSALPGVIKREDDELAAGITRPDYHLAAKTYEDVQKGVKFAAQNNVRVTIIGSGHDFLGRNDAPSGLSIDTSQLRGVRVLQSFTPSANGAEKPLAEANVLAPVAGQQAAVTFGVGMSTQEINNAVSPSKLMTNGAAHGEVKTAGGWGQTGGHGPFTPQYGLGVDQFLEFKVVTADGELRVANKVSNPDLFWALRGGGGGTFGVVVEATVKAYPDVPITVFNWWVNSTEEDSKGLWDAYAYLHTQFPNLVDNHGVSGYYYWYKTALKGMMNTIGSDSTPQKAYDSWKPVLDKLSTFPGMQKWDAMAYTYPTFKAYFDARFGPIKEAGTNTMEGMEGMAGMGGMVKRHGPGDENIPMPMGATSLDSRLLGKKQFADPGLSDALRLADSSKTGYVYGLMGHLTAGNKAAKPDDDVSVLPAWRQAYVHIVGLNIANVSSVDSLRALAPDMGAYANEASPQEKNWKQSFWGANYAKLSALKTKYDPELLFWVTPGINADLAEVKDGRVCRLTKALDGVTPPANDNKNPRDESVANEGTGNEDAYSAFPGTEFALTVQQQEKADGFMSWHGA